jgi:membrane-associated protease RseP (regulator of RpoE activity)
VRIPLGIEELGTLLRNDVGEVMRVEGEDFTSNRIEYHGRLIKPPAEAVALLQNRWESKGYVPYLREARGSDILAVGRVAGTRRETGRWVNTVLLAFTIVTTTLAGCYQEGVDPFVQPHLIYRGIPFSATLLIILGGHELGHYVTARRCGMKASLPFFIPFIPLAFFPVGTLGAVISMRSPIPSRRALLSVGATGPFWGVALAIPAFAIGLRLSTVMSMTGGGIAFGDSLLTFMLSKIFSPPALPGQVVVAHPVAFAGWFGLFVTALNLCPVGQLDGGHVAYALLGPRARTVGRAVLAILFGLGAISMVAAARGRNFSWPGWLMWVLIVTFVLRGTRHPPPLDNITPLTSKDRLIGWGALFLFVLVIPPAPLSIIEP